MRFLYVVVALIALGQTSFADDAAAAKAALELAKARLLLAKEKVAQRELLALPRTIVPMAEAKEKAKSSGKPLFVSTDETESSVVADIRRLGEVVHAPAIGEQGLFRVMVWDGDAAWYYFDWNTMPTRAEAEAKAKELQGYVKKPPAKLPADNGFRISLPVSPADCVGNT